ncbi:MAG: hypothetical protein ACRELG_12450 [Gemmataceae bacterium]
MRKALIIVGLLLCFAAAASAGYLFAIHQAIHQQVASSRGLYRDEDIAPMRKKLTALYLPISHDNAFLLLGIDRQRISGYYAVFEGQTKTGGNWPEPNTANIWCWRLSPGFCLAMYSEEGPDFGPPPTGGKVIRRIAIGKAIPKPGNPGWKFMAGDPNYQVVLDEKDTGKTEISLPRPGKRSPWKDWKYPNLTKTLSSYCDIYNITGGFVGLTDDDFDKVLGFYGEKCRVRSATDNLVESPYTTPDGNQLEYLMFRGFDNSRGNSAVRVRHLNVKTPGYTVSIALVQPQGEQETQIFVNVW